MTELTDRELAILDIESKWWAYAGRKEQVIRETLDITATRYYQLLNNLLDREEALAHDPLLVNRLRRLREQRQLSRPVRRRSTG